MSGLGDDFNLSESEPKSSADRFDWPEEMSAYGRDSQARELHEQAVHIAGMYLREAAFDRARQLLTKMIISNDITIVRVETLLRVVRRVNRPDRYLCGEPIPSLRKTDGTTIPLVIRLVEAVGRDKLLLSEESDDPDSRSKANRAIRSAREEVRRMARDVMLEGEIVA